jgi:biotin transport system substrate-specific component
MQATIPAKRSLAQPEQAFTKTMPGKLALAITASAFVAFCAHISLPLPFTPVPLTLQNFAVLVVGVLLGPGAAFSAMMLYLAEGAIGLPVFSPTGLGGVAQLLGPTGGYLLSYPLAAAVAGLARNIRSRSFTRFTAGLLSTTAATLIILSFGAVWLGHMLHLGSAATWHLSVQPFLFGEAMKIVAAAGIYSSTRRWLRA